MSDLLDLLIPHPAESLFRRGSDILYELLGEGLGAVFDNPNNNDDEPKAKYLIPPLSAQLELIGSHSKKILSLHFLDQPYNGNLKKLEKALNSPSKTDDEKLQKLILLNEAMTEFKFDLDMPPNTLVYEFVTNSGHIQSISCYDGDFTAAGWRWEADRRKFRREGYDLGREFALAQRGYKAMQRVRDVLEENCVDRELELSRRDVYNSYLSALTQIADKEAMKRFVESVSNKSVSRK